MRKWVVILSALLLISACSDAKLEGNKPATSRDARRESRGKLTGDDGLAVFRGGRLEETGSAASPIGVNSYLWRATLDTLSFMPLAAADPFGGIITTDWYEDPKAPGERFKVNALILDKTLRAD